MNYIKTGQLQEAEEILQRTLADLERTPGPNHEPILREVIRLGEFYYGQDKWKEAQALITRALASLEEAPNQDPHRERVAVAAWAYIVHYIGQGDMEESVDMLQRAAAMIEGSDMYIPVVGFSFNKATRDLELYLLQEKSKRTATASELCDAGRLRYINIAPPPWIQAWRLKRLFFNE